MPGSQAVERRGKQDWITGNGATVELRTEYLVPGVDHRAVKTNPFLYGVPDPNRFPLVSYPGQPGMLIRSISVSDSGNGALVKATFSTRRGSRLREDATDISSNEFTWSSSIERVPVEIPKAALMTPQLNNGSGQPAEPRWVKGVFVVPEKRPGIEVSFIANFNEFAKPPFSTLSQFYKEDDRIHQINGLWWKFNVRSITSDDKHQHRITLTWQLDAGTPQTLAGLPSPKVSYPGVLGGFMNYDGLAPEPGLIRNPWYSLHVVEPDAPGEQFKVTQHLDFEFGDLASLPLPPGIFT